MNDKRAESRRCLKGIETAGPVHGGPVRAQGQGVPTDARVSIREISVGNERLLAGMVAALIAWRTRSVLFTLGGGMATLWMLQALGQSL